MIKGVKGKSRKIAMVFLLLAGLAAARNVESWPDRLLYPGDVDRGGDSIPLADLVHFGNGVKVYAAESSKEYNSVNWGPLYYLLGSRLVDLENPSYRPLRLLSLAGVLGCAAACGLLAFWYSRAWLAAALAPLLFLSFGFLTRHGISLRPDSVALMISVAGLLLVYRFRVSRALLLATPLFLVSFYYKQQFVAGPVAVLLFLLLERRYHLAAEFAALMAFGGLTLLAYFQWDVFGGQAFLDHFIFYNILPFTNWAFGLVALATLLLLPLVLGLWSLREKPDRLIVCYLVVALAFSLAASPRAGAGVYYFFETTLILSALMAASVAGKLHDQSSIGFLLLLVGGSMVAGSLSSPPPGPQDFLQDRLVQDYLRQRFSPHTPALGYYSGDLIRAGLDTPITNIFHYTWLVRQGTFAPEDLPGQVRNHRFGVILLTADIRNPVQDAWMDYYLDEAVRKEVLANYRLDAILQMPPTARVHPAEQFYAWVPRPLSSLTRPGPG